MPRRWEDVRRKLFAEREAELAEAADRLRLAVTARQVDDERELAAYEQELSG